MTASPHPCHTPATPCHTSPHLQGTSQHTHPQAQAPRTHLYTHLPGVRLHLRPSPGANPALTPTPNLAAPPPPQEHVDILIVVSNDKLLEIVPEGVPLQEAFSLADEILRQGITGISDIVVKPGLINVDFADVRSVMQERRTRPRTSPRHVHAISATRPCHLRAERGA